ncbi:MAG: DNA polymerase III subunit gamma/tau [Gammaproteobacteria bacterium]|nr:DNA polymerase III subunit gamma/tau [Gammaproteobacteria bacterium]
MSYLVLARKWRPKNFAEVVGQEHVVRALENALDGDRVHHAYLFAGTRGVGKTTIARILAKALNCLEGVSAQPCGQCEACTALDEGRFVDLIEVDAASRTGVDDTRELLENVQYTPTVGRYKVYLIDEVHMLSRQSFNALLKTLEEPPPHVKFLFATTDPQRLPVTVLSRCLQFNLKRLPTGLIAERMQLICDAEDVTVEPGAISRLARAAAGSVRDGLSLLDQALAYGDNRLAETEVTAMLGTMDRHRVLGLIDAIATGEGSALLRQIDELDQDVPDYERVLDDLATALQRVAVIQLAGRDAVEEEEELDRLAGLADALDPAIVQLYYQVAITSRRDLSLAPEPRLGFEMALLRMLAFRPDDGSGTVPIDAYRGGTAPIRGRKPRSASAENRHVVPDKSLPGEPVSTRADLSDWPAFVSGLQLSGAARQLAENCALEAASDNALQLRVEARNSHLVTPKLVERLTEALRDRLGSALAVRIDKVEQVGDTAAVRARAEADARHEDARTAIEQDPQVQQLVDIFDGQVISESVRPKDDTPPAD